jgi:hypothetical protein
VLSTCTERNTVEEHIYVQGVASVAGSRMLRRSRAKGTRVGTREQKNNNESQSHTCNTGVLLPLCKARQVTDRCATAAS